MPVKVTVFLFRGELYKDKIDFLVGKIFEVVFFTTFNFDDSQLVRDAYNQVNLMPSTGLSFPLNGLTNRLLEVWH